MKILVVCNLPPPYGGAEVFARHLAVIFARQGEEVSIVTQKLFEIQQSQDREILQYPYNPERQPDTVKTDIQVFPAFISSFRKSFMSQGLHSLDDHFMESLEDICRMQRPDVVHCHFTTGKLKEVIEVTERLEISLVVTLHGMTNLVPQFDSYLCGGITDKQILSLLAQCRKVVVVSAPMHSYCQKMGLSNVCRIPTGIDIDYYHPQHKTDRRGILYVGKFNEHKGLKQTISGYLDMPVKDKDGLYLVGRGIHGHNVQKIADLFKGEKKEQFLKDIQQNRIHLMDELEPEELRDMYHSVKVLVLPSLTEGFPLVILEALASGTPVIASDVGSISEVIQKGQNGYLIPAGDSEALTHYLVRICEDYSQDFESRCVQSVKNYDMSSIAGRYMNLFREVSERKEKDDQSSHCLQR